MTMNQLRANVRNFLVGLTVAEVRVELDLSIRMGDAARAGYIGEWLSELLTERLDTTNRIHRNHPVREKFAGRSSGAFYYETKGHAVEAFQEALADYGLCFDQDVYSDFDGNEGQRTMRVLNVYDVCVGYAHFSWHRMESGRYEFVGYLS